MKKIQLPGTVTVLIVSLFLFGCKKQFTSPTENDEHSASIAEAALQFSSSQCTPVAFGVYSQAVMGSTPPKWTTLMQRWYNSNGSLAYLKTYIPVSRTDYAVKWLDLQWGAVTYEGNQVYLTDVLKNKMIMRITLNGMGLPEATYYYTDPPQAGIPGSIDTSYYYYTGNRLDSVFNIFRFNSNVTPNQLSQMYRISYDRWGNVEYILPSTPGEFGTRISYNNGAPVSGIMVDYHRPQSMRLLHMMGLLNLPMTFSPTYVVFGRYSPGWGFPRDFEPVQELGLAEPVYTSDRLLQSYIYYGPPFRNTFYAGFECTLSNNNREMNVIGELKDFQTRFPTK